MLKKKVFVAFAVVAVFGLAACSGSSGSKDGTPLLQKNSAPLSKNGLTATTARSNATSTTAAVPTPTTAASTLINCSDPAYARLEACMKQLPGGPFNPTPTPEKKSPVPPTGK